MKKVIKVQIRSPRERAQEGTNGAEIHARQVAAEDIRRQDERLGRQIEENLARHKRTNEEGVEKELGRCKKIRKEVMEEEII